MPQELFIDNPDGAVFSLSDWEEAVENHDKVRLETALEDPDFTWGDGSTEIMRVKFSRRRQHKDRCTEVKAQSKAAG